MNDDDVAGLYDIVLSPRFGFVLLRGLYLNVQHEYDLTGNASLYILYGLGLALTHCHSDEVSRPYEHRTSFRPVHRIRVAVLYSKLNIFSKAQPERKAPLLYALLAALHPSSALA